MKNKLFIFITILTVLLSLVIIPCSADADSGYFPAGTSFTFVENPTFPSFVELRANFSTNGLQCDSLNFIVDESIPGYYEIEYFFLAANAWEVVYDSNGGWYEEEFRTITFTDDYIAFDNTYRAFLMANEYNPPNPGIYDSIYSVIKSGIYGDRVLDSHESLSLDIICTVVCCFIVVLPFLVMWLIIKSVLSAFRGIYD